MRERAENIFLWLVIVIGALLRLSDLTLPDLSTDEVQAAFGVSPAWTPIGMHILRLAQTIFGYEIVVLRSVSLFFGFAFLFVFYALARLFTEQRTALFIVALAAIFPSHILFSKLSYLSIQLCFAWALLLYCFLQARTTQETKWMYAVFFASIFATLMKVQGFLLPSLFILGILYEKRKEAPKDTLLWTLILSLIPFGFYALTHPGIAATILLYKGTVYGVTGPVNRLITLIVTWWSLLGLFLVAIVLSLRSIKKLAWPVWATLLLGAGIGFVLGPSHEYYVTYLVFFALPIGLELKKYIPVQRNIFLIVLLMGTLFTLGPHKVFSSSWTHPLYREEGVWNTHAEEINAILAGEDEVTVLGHAGHHVRWYLEPRVLVGKNLEQPYPTDYVVLLGISETANVTGKLEHVAGHVAVVRQHSR